MRTLNENEVSKIRALYGTGALSYKALGERFGVPKQAIARACEGIERPKGPTGIATWGQVHESGDTRKSWNHGKRSGEALAADAELMRQRMLDQRIRLVREYEAAGILDRGSRVGRDYIERGA